MALVFALWPAGGTVAKNGPLFYYFFLSFFLLHVFSGGRRIENHGRKVTNEFVGVVVIDPMTRGKGAREGLRREISCTHSDLICPQWCVSTLSSFHSAIQWKRIRIMMMMMILLMDLVSAVSTRHVMEKHRRSDPSSRNR